MMAFKENSLLFFNSAAFFPIHFVEFDVQVTKDGCPIVFHDTFILSEQLGSVIERRVTDLTLSEFLEYGPQKEECISGKPLLRKSYNGKISKWIVEKDDYLCTLQQAFEMVEPRLGFNIELKFDDDFVYHLPHLTAFLRSVLQVVVHYAKERPIIFSSFHPDAALLVRKMQDTYPVFFLTDGGTHIYIDVRRNSVEEAIKVCLEGGLQGIVSEVRGIFRNPAVVTNIKDSGLSLLTYGYLNNVPEAVYMQHLMGVDGVIVDLVREIIEAVSGYDLVGEEGVVKDGEELRFSNAELAFLLKLIPQLV